MAKDKEQMANGKGNLKFASCHSPFEIVVGSAGASLVELALAVPFLCLLVIGIIDFGRAYYLSLEVQNAAYAGALYGLQNNTDTTGMVAAAKADAPDITTPTWNDVAWVSNYPSASYGCECADGSSSSPSCASPPACSTGTTAPRVNWVQVTTQATFTPMFHTWKWASLTLQGSAKLRSGQ